MDFDGAQIPQYSTPLTFFGLVHSLFFGVEAMLRIMTEHEMLSSAGMEGLEGLEGLESRERLYL